LPLLDREGEVVIAKKIENGEMEVLYSLVEVPVAIEELIKVATTSRTSRSSSRTWSRPSRRRPLRDEMNQRQRVIFLLDEIKSIFKKKRRSTRTRRLRRDQPPRDRAPEGDPGFKEEVVQRLRDIKLEKTLIDASSRPWATMCARCTTATRPLGLRPVRGQDQGRHRDLFRQVDARDVNPVVAADTLNIPWRSSLFKECSRQAESCTSPGQVLPQT
jgi:RNA polymerase primary sigma factor